MTSTINLLREDGALKTMREVRREVIAHAEKHVGDVWGAREKVALALHIHKGAIQRAVGAKAAPHPHGLTDRETALFEAFKRGDTLSHDDVRTFCPRPECADAKRWVEALRAKLAGAFEIIAERNPRTRRVFGYRLIPVEALHPTQETANV